VNHSSVPEPPQPRESSKEGDQPSPVSVLEASFDDDVSSGSECFESVSADLRGSQSVLASSVILSCIKIFLYHKN